VAATGTSAKGQQSTQIIEHSSGTYNALVEVDANDAFVATGDARTARTHSRSHGNLLNRLRDAKNPTEKDTKSSLISTGTIRRRQNHWVLGANSSLPPWMVARPQHNKVPRLPMTKSANHWNPINYDSWMSAASTSKLSPRWPPL